MRNTKEVDLIQIRSGRESELPEALHQGEFGLAVDTNRVFIGNPNQIDLKNRVEFPFRNLELLTEFTDFKDKLTYTYINNIDGMERLPIVIVSTATPSITEATTLGIQTISGTDNVVLETTDTLDSIVTKINNVSNETIRALKTSSNKLCIVAYDAKLILTGTSAISQLNLTGQEITESSMLPERLLRSKLDDFVTSADFDIVGNESSDISTKLINALRELYNKDQADNQYFRTFRLLAGTYKFSGSETLPLLSNMYIKGDGIDKTTLLVSNYTNTSLFNSTNGDLADNTKAENTVIEDLTIDVSSLLTQGFVLSKISNGSTNITFRNVKFVSSNSATCFDLNNCSYIKFENCIFKSFTCGIIGANNTHIEIRNCLFNNVANQSVKLSSNVGLIMNSNTFSSCGTEQTYTGGIIDISDTCSYSTIMQSEFDSAVLSDYSRLFKRQANDYTNYVDTLDASTNERKLLKFKFLQPQWEYIDYLVNNEGKTSVVIDDSQYGTTSTQYPLADNPLKISTDTALTLENIGSDDLVIKSTKSSNVVIGSYDEVTGDKGNIITKKDVELNGAGIKNLTGTNDIVITTADDKIITVGDTTSSNTPYSQRVLNQTNAIPNVEYVDRVAKTTIQKSITTEDASSQTANGILICSLDSNKYGSTISLKQLGVNIKKPLFNMFSYLNTTDSIAYTIGLKYYSGDIVTDGTNYAVVTEEHIATTTFALELGNRIKTIVSGPSDIKYVDIVAITPYNKVSLTRDTEYDEQDTNYVILADERNNRSMYPVSIPSVGTTVTAGSVYSENERFYKCSQTTYVIASKTDLHNATNFLKLNDEGYNYIFDLDRIYANIESDNSFTTNKINFADAQIYIRFYNEQKVLLTPIPLTNNTDVSNTYTKISPNAQILVNVEFIRG